MRRRNYVLPIAFAASMLGGCLGSFGSPGEGTGTSTGTGAGNGAGTGAGNGSGSGNGATTGGGDGTPTPAPAPTPTMPPAVQGTFAAKLDKATDSIRLNETKSYTLTLTPANGLTGGVTLALDTPPAGVTAVFTPATVNITDANPVTVSVAITVASDATATATATPVAIKAVSGTINASASIGLTIPAELLIQVAKGVAIGSAAAPNTTAFGMSGTMNVKYVTGLKITFVNNDLINHEMHMQGTANTAGIPHETGPLMANAANVYTQTITGPILIKSTDWRCHIHSNMLGFNINIQ